MHRSVCIHGHFYQPPRENPWTGVVEAEGSALPFHDWNERITAECYAPNADSPLAEAPSEGAKRVNNYSWISFDFGPTLLRWLETQHPDVHQAIVDADRESAERFGGHGSAMAQVYNHMIMPLADAHDKKTQTKWGVEDFERRFGRYPEGMWLPETAADTPSLEALAEEGIKFTILSPDQALATRREGEGNWTDVSGGRIDTRRAYTCRLPSGKRISLFFYDRRLSTGLAFENLLDSGESFSKAVLGGFHPGDEPQLVNIATDGESYGHHRRNGHLALASCISKINSSSSASMVNYGLFLSVVPPAHEVRIAEGTSWSCFHGVERWRSNCGCGSEIKAGYNQDWRTPLRTSLDWLRDRLEEAFAAAAPLEFTDPGAAWDHYPTANLTRPRDVDQYVRGRLKPGRSEERGRALLRMVECSALMFASCAWFWEDISRMETVQMLRFAARGMDLAKEVSMADFEPDFKRLLSIAVPNDRKFPTGADIYDLLVRPAGAR
jgi:alpha-amylase/alpha-mannosidase (GH57 family)